MTFGAGGSTQQGTLETVLEIRAAGQDAAPHLSCVASSRAEIAEILKMYKDHGIRHLVALRGDRPSGLAFIRGELWVTDINGPFMPGMSGMTLPDGALIRIRRR